MNEMSWSKLKLIDVDKMIFTNEKNMPYLFDNDQSAIYMLPMINLLWN